MFGKKISVDFIASEEKILSIAPHPYPASNKLPSWFGSMERYVEGIKSIDRNNDPTSTIKKCMPVVDLMSAGYIIPLHSDAWLHNNGENDLSFQWALDSERVIVYQPSNQHKGYPTPYGYYNSVFKWINPWIVKTPPGWSCLFLHPSHREDLPFRCLSALVDTDKHPAPVNLPFVVRKGFSGLISAETPIIQIIPFKRENFSSTIGFDKNNFFKNLWNKAHTVFFERYQRFFWSPKKFDSPVEKKNKCPFGF